MNRRRFVFIAATLFGLHRASGQLLDVLEAGRELLERELDPAFLRALESVDMQQAEQTLEKVAELFESEYVVDLAALSEGVRTALSLLEAQPETRSYADWLRARLDYFEIADDFRRSVPAPRPVPGQPPPRPIPTPEQQRKAWQRKTKERPEPKGAFNWVQRLKPIFRKAGAPSGLVWLAEIESSFNPQARSPAGAAGMFQLMPKTAEGLGLKLTPQDERLDPEKNARAAATYLQQLHQQFRDWRLALAAYNAGPGRVSKILKSRRAQSFDAIAPNLPSETQLYVPKFESVLKKREGVALTSLQATV